MSDMNRTAQQGNLVNDPELTTFDNDDKVVRFSIATTESWQDNESEWQERTSFFDVEARGEQAERINENFEQGNRAIVEGRLRQDRWENDAGETRSRVKIRAYRVSKDGYPEGREQDPEEIIENTTVEGEASNEEQSEEDLFSKDSTPI